ncbi:MAG: 3-phosphoshikimate 1-carboxyvinyltransferase [candidate division Zixibacteria bacterium]|nr:3-phosphoshikimate 1-carboxyvinyltransferase [candidate division Zixibacteria bacterium]
MKKLYPAKRIEGTISLPGDKSIGHRAALLSLLAKQPMTVSNFPNAADCQSSLNAIQQLGVSVERENNTIRLFPPKFIHAEPDTIVDCGNSGTTARLLSGIIAGSDLEITLTGDESLSSRPMKRVIDPLTEMGAEIFSDEGHLPLRIRGSNLSSFKYQLPIASAQVKSSLLLAGLSSGCSTIIREDTITRNHTEIMIKELGGEIRVQDIKPVLMNDPKDPRKRRMQMPESFKREIVLSSQAKLAGGEINIPGDISTASFFMAAAAIDGGPLTIENVGLNTTRNTFLSHLKSVGASIEITNKQTISGEPRGTVTVSGGKLKPRRISGETTVGLIDEIPIVAVIAAFTDGTTIIRDASELKVKESNRLEAVAHNLKLMGIKCGVLKDGLAIEGGKELSGADFKSFGDHRIVMAFSIASLFAVGPSTIDDESTVKVSCPEFFDLLETVSK